jgi:hypothetical protein
MATPFIPGSTTYLDDLNTLYNAVITTPSKQFRLTADGSAIGNTIADYFGTNSTLTLSAAGIYEYTFDLYFLKTTAGTVTFTLTSSNAPVNLVANYVGGPVTGVGTAGAPITAAIDGSTSSAAALPVTTTLSTAVEHRFRISALIEVNATTPSTFKLQCTESAGTITPRRGSAYSVRQIPTLNVGTFT